MARRSLSITVDTSALTDFAARVSRSADEMNRRVASGLQRIGNAVADDVRSRASYSRWIPAAVHVSMSGTSGTLTVDGTEAPDAAPIENRGKGFVRHPVYGNREVWTSKNSHPAFFAPAVSGAQTKVDAEAQAIADEVIASIDE